MINTKELNKYFSIIIITLLLSSCTQSDETNSEKTGQARVVEFENTNTTMPLDRFVTWINDEENHLLKVKEISDINYQMSYTPKECLAYQELKGEEYTKEKFAETTKHYEGMTYFNLKIEVEEGAGELLKYKLTSPQQYNSRITYMSFEMQKDICLVQGKDTLYPGLYHFERIFSIAPYATVLLAFDNEKFKTDQEFTLVYNDRLFNKGFIKYNYSSKQLIDLPNISGV